MPTSRLWLRSAELSIVIHIPPQQLTNSIVLLGEQRESVIRNCQQTNEARAEGTMIFKSALKRCQLVRQCGCRRLKQPQCFRFLSTLDQHPHIYVFPDPKSLNNAHLLTLLPTDPPTSELAIGSTTSIPPTPRTFSENSKFVVLMQETLKDHAFEDASAISQARAHASSSGSTPSMGVASSFDKARASQRMAGKALSSNGSNEGKSGGVGGWIHLSDSRKPPDFGRIAEPEDILGSLQVDGNGQFVGSNGSYQPSGTYRVITNDGILGLSNYLLDRIAQRLRNEETK
ncbi:MAG: hypothetical protein M1814_002624 [Vezdaea aestivalis]|nr:MAG: hypothetical protein M1814_002624 [Vezdaea aestivalis]